MASDPIDLRRLFDDIDFAVMAFAPLRDDNGRLVDFAWRWANRACLTFLHQSWADLDGRPLTETLPQNPDEVLRHYIDAFEKGAEYSAVVAVRVEGFDGALEVHARRVDDLLAVRVVDVSERLRLERERSDALETVERVLARISDGIFALDADWHFVLVNASAEKMLGERAEDLLGRVIWEAFPHAVGTEFEFHYREAAASGEPVTFDAYYPDPLDTWYRVRVFPDHVGITVHFTDIGSERRIEERVAHYDRLESASTLAGGVAHDFNNLLMVVAGHTSFLADDLPDDHPAQDDIRAIAEATDRATALTRQLLSFTSQQVVNPIVIDLNDALLTERAALEQRLPEGVNLAVFTRDEPVLTEIDESELRRLCHHLVDNAAEAMTAGGTVVIETSVSEIDEEAAQAYPNRSAGVYAVITVSDEGEGMAPDVLARATEPFFTTRRHDGGTGLGLSAVHGIARQAGGQVSIYSEAGVGTTVRVMLRSHESADHAPVVDPSPEEADGTETLLVVDDNTSIGRLIERALTARGYTVLMASSGAEALEATRRSDRQVAMLITDVVMPGMTGAELAVALRAEVGVVPVLYVSGYTENTVIVRGVPGEDVEFLAKPFAARDLVRRVRGMLDRS